MATTSGSGHRIFISHSHKDNEFGIKLVEDLRRVIGDESAVWYDSRGGLSGGDIWWDKIKKEIIRRRIFIVILSPDAVKSPWVQIEINMAWKRFREKKAKFIPILYRQCKISLDLQITQMISFLEPRAYEEAFQELLRDLKLPSSSKNIDFANLSNQSGYNDIQQIIQRMKIAFRREDWSYIIERANSVIGQYPDVTISSFYYMQGVAYLYKNEFHRALDALAKGLEKSKNIEETLRLLDAYTATFVSSGQWDEVLVRANQALTLRQNHPIWQMAKKDAQTRVHQKIGNFSGRTMIPLTTIKEEITKVKNDKAKFHEHNVQIKHDTTENMRHTEGSIKTLSSDNRIKEIEVQKQQLGLQKERFQLERDFMTFAFEIAEKTANLYTNADAATRALLLRNFLANFLQLDMNE